MRQIAGSTLLAGGLAAAVFFDPVLDVMVGVASPDGAVEPATRLALYICVVSCVVPGSVLLVWRPIERWLTGVTSALAAMPPSQFAAILVSTAFILRLAVVLLLPSYLGQDWGSYHELGITLAQTGKYLNGTHATAYWPPGHPYVLSVFYDILGVSTVGPRLFFALIGSLTALVTYRLGALIGGETNGRLAGTAVAVFPSLVLMTNLLASEHLFIYFLLLGLHRLIREESAGTLRGSVTAGIIFGVAALFRSIAALLAPVLLFTQLVVPTSHRTGWRQAGGVVAGLVLVLAPWMVRNQIVVGAPVLTTNTGVNLLIGNHPRSGLGYSDAPLEGFDVNAPDEVATNNRAMSEALDNIAANPGRFIVNGFGKVALMMSNDLAPIHHGLKQHSVEGGAFEYVALGFIAQGFYLVVVLGAGAVVVRYWRYLRRNRVWWVCLGVIGYWCAVHFVFFGDARFHLPLLPVLAVLACLNLAKPVVKSADDGYFDCDRAGSAAR